jgi:hypothetical protein
MEAEQVGGAALDAATAPTAVITYQIPDHLHVEVDADGWQWTNIQGAMALAGKSRRTIQAWIANGWVVVRRTASNRPQIKVHSLWSSPEAGA